MGTSRIHLKSIVALLALYGALLIPAAKGGASPQAIKACATVPDLGSLLQEIGGDQVAITVFAKGKEDPHFVEAKPSFIKALSQAELYVQIGMDLEAAWAPVLLQNARNGQVLPGAGGFLDASSVISPLEIPTGPVDRSMGDVHAKGNPHYLTDPLNGLRVARLLREKMTQLRPGKRDFFDERYRGFHKKLGEGLLGKELAGKYDPEKMGLLYEEDKLVPFLRERKEDSLLGGWLGMMLPWRGTKVVSDHNIWPYFAHRFGMAVVGFLEPKPGVSPTTRHLQFLVEKIKGEGIRAILVLPYFDARHAQFVSRNTRAKIVALAHQVGARPGADDYGRMMDYNIRQLVSAFGDPAPKDSKK